jgi:hypothetical protein
MLPSLAMHASTNSFLCFTGDVSFQAKRTSSLGTVTHVPEQSAFLAPISPGGSVTPL